MYKLHKVLFCYKRSEYLLCVVLRRCIVLYCNYFTNRGLLGDVSIVRLCQRFSFYSVFYNVGTSTIPDSGLLMNSKSNPLALVSLNSITVPFFTCNN